MPEVIRELLRKLLERDPVDLSWAIIAPAGNLAPSDHGEAAAVMRVEFGLSEKAVKALHYIEEA